MAVTGPVKRHAATPSGDAIESCLRQVRADDRGRYFCVLAAPASARAALLALLAFNLEIARTRELVREPMLGQIRLQWWRHSVTAIRRGDPPGLQPVLEALAAAGPMLSPDDLLGLIEARERDLDDTPFASLSALESYIDGTAGAVARAMLAPLGVVSPAATAAAGDAGLAFGLVGLIRAVPFHAAQRRLYLPSDLMAAHGVAAEALFVGRPPHGLPAVLRALALRARQALAAARARRREVPAAAVPALLQAVAAERHLTGLEEAGFDVFASRAEPAPALLPMAMLWHSLRRRY